MTDSDIDDSRNPSSDSSCSKSIIETVNGSHHFEIKGYSLAKGIGAGKYIASDTFNVGGYDWAIYFYPDGKNPEDSSTYVSVFIALASDGTDVRALFELTLVDQKGGGKDKVHSHFDRALESGPYTLKYKGSMWGYKRFFKRSSLESSEYLENDSLLLKCTVGVVKSRTERPKQYRISISPSDMGKDFKQFLDDEIGCDVVFEVGRDKFKAHKLVLAARSPVFRAQFYEHPENPNLNTTVIEDLEPSIFKAMLIYIYSDSLAGAHDILGSSSSCSATIMVQHLLAAADRFGLDRLKLLCGSKLCDEITVETVSATLSLAEQHRCVQLKSACLKFATANLNAVMNTEGFRSLEKSRPSLLSELLETVASVDENLSGKKRSASSSIHGLDLTADGIPADTSNPNGRRVRRRF